MAFEEHNVSDETESVSEDCSGISISEMAIGIHEFSFRYSFRVFRHLSESCYVNLVFRFFRRSLLDLVFQGIKKLRVILLYGDF
ncbi:hypothetical protein [Caldanaerovirga acetigignens]|uniref:hypothetical protein n=1 Tax=Caldanaerovirga acetigignens TaxID=447595 RepID=UPI001FCA9CC5|nr:hypothetical protein [Caldanaerovirga acetigignens]